MFNRITNDQLDNVCKRINKAPGYAEEPYTRGEDGLYLSNYHIDSDEGGVMLSRMCDTGVLPHGDVVIRDVLSCGHVPKRELFSLLLAFEQGIVAGRAS